MRVIVCGGRNFRSPAQVCMALDRIHAETPITGLMQGGARGVDEFASWWARMNCVPGWVCHADWKRFGPRAGPIRNARMLEWKPDAVIAFPGGRGTWNMTEQAREAGVRVIEPLSVCNGG